MRTPPTRFEDKNPPPRSALFGLMDKLRAGEPISSEAADEIERVLYLLQGEGWSGFLPADRVLKVIIDTSDKNPPALFPAVDDIRVAEQLYEEVASAHRERGEWEAGSRAADVADHTRYYRLQREFLDEGKDVT